jgi:membrane protease YdiL (CAAX protease family)
VTLLVVSVTPAICEETLCRGVLARAFFPRFGMRGAVVISAALFALLHLSPYRFVPTFLLGLSLGWVALRTSSIVPSMIIHALNNGSVVILTSLGAGPNAFLDTHSNVIGPVAVVALTAGHALVALPTRAPR